MSTKVFNSSNPHYKRVKKTNIKRLKVYSTAKDIKSNKYLKKEKAEVSLSGGECCRDQRRLAACSLNRAPRRLRTSITPPTLDTFTRPHKVHIPLLHQQRI